jgi:phosphatidylglycerophosphate synthase
MQETSHRRSKMNEFLPAERKDYPIRHDRYIALENKAVSFLARQRLIHPNHITWFRFALAGVLLCFSGSMTYLPMSILVGLGAFSDFLDGAFARAASQKTRLGMIIDPLADKFLVFVIMYALILRKAIDPMIVLLMLGMEAHLVLVPMLSVMGKRHQPRRAAAGGMSRRSSLPIASQAGLPGKAKFMLYALGLLAVLVGNVCGSYPVQRVGTLLLVLGIAAGAVALVQYVIRWRKRDAADRQIQPTQLNGA